MKQSGITALYSRLSRDDELVGDSNSIKTQKAMLEEYAAKNGFTNCVHFSDDGFSGKDFSRPGWQALIEEVEAGNVAVCLSKDMSRVGRDYLQTGFYTEVYFREKGVRFIAIANNIDSQNRESSEFAPFLNIMSEWYLRDASRKVKASHKARGMSGRRLTFTPIYGYRLDPSDKEKWIIDDESAEIVRRIFALCIAGRGPVEIARILVEEKVERPTYYQATRGIVNYKRHDMSVPHAWSGNSVAHILDKPEYMGDTVNFRNYKESYKDKKYKEVAKEDWIIFEDTHPAIVNRETWETAQKCRGTKRRKNDLGEANPLTGLVYCSDCGAKLYNHRQLNPYTYVNKKGYTCTRQPKDIYTCSTYNLSGRRYDHKCTQHHISTKVLRQTVLEAIKEVSALARLNEADFVSKLREASTVRREETAKSHKQRISQGKRRISELNSLIKHIYEDNVSGKLNDKRFNMLSEEYEAEQNELEQTIAQMQLELDAFNADTDRTDKFIEIVRKYTDFSELTAPMIAEYVDKIIVHEADKSSGERKQKIEIFLNFIGKFELQPAELTPEQIVTEEVARLKRERCRDAQRRYVARKKEAAALAKKEKPERVVHVSTENAELTPAVAV